MNGPECTQKVSIVCIIGYTEKLREAFWKMFILRNLTGNNFTLFFQLPGLWRIFRRVENCLKT